MLSPRPFRWIIVLLYGAALAAAGCGPAPIITSLAAPEATPGRPATSLSPAPRVARPSPDAGFADGAYTREAYKLTFASGQFTLITLPGQEWASGHFTVTGNAISFAEEDAEPECQPLDNHFTYGWSFNGQSVSFTVISDTCSAQLDFLPATRWTYESLAPR